MDVHYRAALKRPSADSAEDSNTNTSKKKLVVACSGCRKKKIKCSADRPACSNCLRQNIPCDYPPIRNRGSRFGYQEMMNRRLKSLEKYVDFSVPPKSGPTSSPVQLSDASTTITDMLNQIDPPHAINTNNNNIVDQGSSRTPGSSKNLPLPPMEIVLHLVELYFTHVHNQTYSFLHKPTFIPRIRQNKVDPCLVYAICGLSARYSRHPKVLQGSSGPRHTLSEQYLKNARKAISTQVFHETPTLETVQALICLIQNDFFCAKSGKTMIYISLATRAAHNLYINDDKHHVDKETWLESEIRRRTFWSLMVLDRLAHGSPSWSLQFLYSNFSNLPLPCTTNDFDNNVPVETTTLELLGSGGVPPPTLGLFAYHILAVMLWCDVNKYVLDSTKAQNPEIHMCLQQRLDSFFSFLPEKYHYSAQRLQELRHYNVQGQFIHLHAELQAARCVLNTSAKQFDKATEAANTLSNIVNDILHSEDDLTVAPFVGYAVLTVSAVHVSNSFSSSSSVAETARNNLTNNLKLLIQMKDYWYSVGVWCQMLKDRYSKMQTNSADPSDPPLPYLPDGVLQKESNQPVVQKPPSPMPEPVMHKQQQQQPPVLSSGDNSYNQSNLTANQAMPPPQNPSTVSQETPAPNYSSPPQGSVLTPGTNFNSPYYNEILLSEPTAIDQFTAEWFADLQTLMDS
jgi:hypothetical protein